jgi:hypothetical protein
MTLEDILTDLLAHQYAANGTPSEEFEDDDFDAEGMMAAAAAGDDWETLING